jgi:hypothetical protein
MCDPRVVELVEEIRELYERQCAYADRLRSANQAENQELITKSQVRENANLPELQHFRNVFEYHDALKRAREDPQIRGRTKLATAFNWLAVFGGSLVILWFTGSYFAMLLGAVLLGGLLVSAESRLFFRAHWRRSLREQLVERGVPICLDCGYDLRGQVEPRCPECGTACAPSLLKTAQEN